MDRRTDTTAPRHALLRTLASGPVRLLFGVAVLLVVAVAMLGTVTAGTVVVPNPALDTSGRPPLPRGGERLIAVLQSDQLTPEYVGAIQRITERAEVTQGVTLVRSMTTTPVLVRLGVFQAGATPAVGPRSGLPLQYTLSERAVLAANSRLGTADLISADGRTAAVIAELEPGLSPADRARAADQFRSLVESEAAAAGIGITSHVAGDAYTAIAATDGMRSDLLTLLVLAVVAPAAIALVVTRRRVPVGALLAASGAALLLASVLVVNTIGEDAGALPADHPVAVGNRIVDEKLRGIVPIEVEFVGAPGDFRKPEVLARLDALANWLRDQSGVNATGLSSTIRDEAGVITGVDSVPPNPEDLNRLIEDAAAFEGGTFLPTIVNDDFSRTRLIGSWPDRGTEGAESLAANFDRIAGATLAGTGVAARLEAKIPSVASATTNLANLLATLGVVALVLGAGLALLGLWASHALDDRLAAEGWDPDAAPEDDPEDEVSLFARDLTRDPDPTARAPAEAPAGGRHEPGPHDEPDGDAATAEDEPRADHDRDEAFAADEDDATAGHAGAEREDAPFGGDAGTDGRTETDGPDADDEPADPAPPIATIRASGPP